MSNHITRRGVNAGIGAALVSPALSAAPALAQAAAPIKIGFSMALTGPLAPNGKQALLGAEVWAEEVNAKGGLLGRQVQLVHYDDQSNPSTVPGIYTKLLDIDKCDLVVGPYATNIGGTGYSRRHAEGQDFHRAVCARCQRPVPLQQILLDAAVRPDAEESFSEGFFQIAAGQNPRPQTVAIAAEDADFSHNAADGARNNVKKYGFKTVYDKTYPPNTTDFSPIVRAIQATNPDLVVICSYPLSSVGMLLSANELGLKPKMMGAGMVGLQATALKDKLKSHLNGIVNYETWVPAPKLMAPAADFFKKYQARAASAGADPLGYYLGGWGYAYLQVLADGIVGSKSIKDDDVAGYLRSHSFDTIMASDIRFGKNGEWTKSGMLQVQYHGITEAANLDTWRGMSYQTVLTPTGEKTGNVIYPYAKASS